MANLNALGPRQALARSDRRRQQNTTRGEARALGPTIPMRFGAALNPLFRRVQDIFPESNPYGSAIENFILGDSVGLTERMAEGIPHQLTGAGPNDPIVRPQIVDIPLALPIASTLQLAKAAAVPAVMATGAGLLGRALKGKKYAPASTEDMASVLLTPVLQRQGLLDEAMVGGVEGAANLAKAGNNRPALAIELAKRLENEGVSRDEIWTRTSQSYGYGVYRGKDGKLRLEKDDSAAAGVAPVNPQYGGY